MLGILIVVFCVCNGLAFTNFFDVTEWQISLPAAGRGGDVDFSNVPNSVTIEGPDGSNCIGDRTEFAIVIPFDTTITFDWSYSSTDSGQFDDFNVRFCVMMNEMETILADNASQGSGSESFFLAAGTVFSFRVDSSDCIFGAGFATISNFQSLCTDVADGAACNGDVCFDSICSSGSCVTDVPSALGTPCTDTDGNECTDACDGNGVCDQSVGVAAGTSCTDTDGNECTDACDGNGVCDQSVGVAAGTSCTNECFSDTTTCDGSGFCAGSSAFAAGTPCTDTDGNECTDACDGNGVCDPAVGVAAGTSCTNDECRQALSQCNGAGSCETLVFEDGNLGCGCGLGSPDIDDGCEGTCAATGATDLVALSDSVGCTSISYNVLDSADFLWDYRSNGWSDGNSDAFDGYGRWRVDGTDLFSLAGASCTRDTTLGQSVMLGATTASGLTVDHESFTFVAGTGARQTVVFRNPTAADISTTLLFFGNLGSDSSTQVDGTSNGNTVVEVSDSFFLTSDGNNGNSDPPLVHAMGGPGAAVQLSSATLNVDNPAFEWNLDVPAGGVVAILVYIEQLPAVDLVGPQRLLTTPMPAALTDGLPVALLSQIVNWLACSLPCGVAEHVCPTGFCPLAADNQEFCLSIDGDCSADSLAQLATSRACEVRVTGPTIGAFVPETYSGNYGDCSALLTSNGALLRSFAASGGPGGASIEFEACVAQGTVFTPNNRKRQSGAFQSSGGGTFGITSAAASAVGDPHLRGAHGEKYDFFGFDGGIYNLFSTKQFVINVLLGKEAKNHFIKHVGVCFRGKCEQFGLARQRVPEHFIGTLNKQLSKVGGHARFPGKSQMVIELELCQGHRIVLEKEITNRGKRIPYFDIEVEVPGCHDDFDGALGQTYKCKYAEHKEKFTFNKSMEEHFRVKSLTSQFGLYNSTMVAPCQSVESFNTQRKSVSGKVHH